VTQFLLDPVYSDFVFTAARMTFIGSAYGTAAQEFAQKLNQRFGFGKGEWFLDQNQGFPWLQGVLGLKNPSVPAVVNLVRSVILGTPGALRILGLNSSFNRTTRQISITNIQVEHDSTAVIVGGMGTPFIVQTGALSATPTAAA
jgi:hypothetical protein